MQAKKITRRQRARLTLRELLRNFDIREAQAFALAQVTASTWRRWMAGTANPPAATVRLIELYATGRVMPDAWRDCRFTADALIDDYGVAHTLGDLRVFQLYRRHHYAYLAQMQADEAKKADKSANVAPLGTRKISGV